MLDRTIQWAATVVALAMTKCKFQFRQSADGIHCEMVVDKQPCHGRLDFKRWKNGYRIVCKKCGTSEFGSSSVLEAAGIDATILNPISSNSKRKKHVLDGNPFLFS